MTYISCFSDFAFYFYYYFMENCHTWIIISMWQNDLHTNTSRSVWPILYGLMIKMLQYKMYPAGELRCPTTALVYCGGKVKISTFPADIFPRGIWSRSTLVFFVCLFFYFSLPLFNLFLSQAPFNPIIFFKILPKTKLNRKGKLYLFLYNLKDRGKFSYSALLFSKVIGRIRKN